ncbi:MAG: TetR/AcrR family transcriptional regulator [Oceanospirillaceae bacterium]
MPYSPAHKEKTRDSILRSARALFSMKGFDAVTVNDVMNDCSLTRGAFYAHFKSKAELYQHALKYSAVNSELAKTKPERISSHQWLSQLLDAYLSFEHVSGHSPCPMAFMAIDIALRDEATKGTYTESYRNMNRIIMSYLDEEALCNKERVFALTSMIIGAVAIARNIDDSSLVESILTSCREQTKIMLGEF